ncbi:MAG: hypothetical protein ACW99F_17085 [Candidatus Hodarchaeales archaeon]|jgi:hypothetical protein
MPDVFLAKEKQNRKKATVPKNIKKKSKNHSFSKKILTKRYTKDRHPLSSFRFYPEHADFLNKDPEEKVILLLRKHSFTNLGWILKSFVIIIAPAFITILPFFTLMPYGFQIISILSWYLLVSAYVFEKFLSWFYHANIITDERIFDIDFNHMTNRKITDAEIDQIQDVTVEISGTIGTVLNYGNVLIQTAAEIPQVEFESVPEPDKVARILRELRIEEEVEKLEGRIR